MTDEQDLPVTRPYFHFLDDNLLVAIDNNLVCALILWGSDLGSLMSKFRQFSTVICYIRIVAACIDSCFLFQPGSHPDAILKGFFITNTRN